MPTNIRDSTCCQAPSTVPEGPDRTEQIGSKQFAPGSRMAKRLNDSYRCNSTKTAVCQERDQSVPIRRSRRIREREIRTTKRVLRVSKLSPKSGPEGFDRAVPYSHSVSRQLRLGSQIEPSRQSQLIFGALGAQRVANLDRNKAALHQSRMPSLGTNHSALHS